MSDLVRSDFAEEGKFQWVAHKGGYRLVVHRTDGGYEILISAEITADPSELEWDKAIASLNRFYQALRIADKSE